MPYLSLDLLSTSLTTNAPVTEDIIFYLLTRKASLTDSDVTIPDWERFNKSPATTCNTKSDLNKPLPPPPTTKPRSPVSTRLGSQSCSESRRPPPAKERLTATPTPTNGITRPTSRQHDQCRIPYESAIALLRYIEVLDADVAFQVAQLRRSIHETRTMIYMARMEHSQSQSPSSTQNFVNFS